MFKTSTILEEQTSLEREIESLWKDEELLWRQRANLNWTLEGDRNTKFFHTAVKYRKQRNLISKLQDESNTWISDPTHLESLATNFFETLFTANQNLKEGVPLEGFPKIVGEEINVDLCRSVTNDEIHKAVFSLGAGKSPGLDGFSGQFYRSF
ncbi:Transposon TX1 uncharacterized 149 kDa protein [Linum perenne]